MNLPFKSVDAERSKSHRRVEEILDKMGISYMSEQPYPPYTVDVYLPEWHLVLEIDGPFHSKTKDEIRDKWLYARYGLHVLHLNAKRWLTRTKIENSIRLFIENNADTAYKRKIIGP